MPAFFQNKYVKFIAIGVALIITISVVFVIVIASLSSARSIGLSGGGFASDSLSAPEIARQSTVASRGPAGIESDFYNPTLDPAPSPGGYTSDLERYETTDYNITGRSNEFDTLCALLSELKADTRYDFQYLASNRNQCRAQFFVNDSEAPAVVARFSPYDELTINRDTQSVTRHREQLQGRADIVRQQLANVERSLRVAETDFDEIASFARTNNDASVLAETLREKLNLIDTLTERRIRLTEQLDTLYQASAELEARISRTAITVSITRAFADDPDRVSRAWEAAWRELKETFNDTLIGLTATFGIYLLWLVRITIYLAVALVALRGLWKFLRFIWRY